MKLYLKVDMRPKEAFFSFLSFPLFFPPPLLLSLSLSDENITTWLNSDENNPLEKIKLRILKEGSSQQLW